MQKIKTDIFGEKDGHTLFKNVDIKQEADISLNEEYNVMYVMAMIFLCDAVPLLCPTSYRY